MTEEIPKLETLRLCDSGPWERWQGPQATTHIHMGACTQHTPQNNLMYANDNWYQYDKDGCTHTKSQYANFIYAQMKAVWVLQLLQLKGNKLYIQSKVQLY